MRKKITKATFFLSLVLFLLVACSSGNNNHPVTEPYPAEVKPPEVKPPEVKPPEVKPPEVKPPEVKPPEIKPPLNNKRAVGINLSAIRDYSATVPFVDVFRSSRPFHKQDPSLILDEQGWVKSLSPGQVATTYMLWDVPGRYPSGTYTVLYDGRGKLAYGGSAKRVSQSKGKERINVNAKINGIELKIVQTDAANPIRNIRVIMPGGICKKDPYSKVTRADECNGDYVAFVDNYQEQIFNPEVLAFLRPFKVLRFMDTMETNGSKVKHWADRHRFDDATWAGEQGAPIEVMVELANRLNTDAWFTLPHLAKEDYVKALAKYLKEKLNENSKIYIEYSNEVWNGQFPQFHYAIAQGEKLKLDSNKWLAGQKFYARRSIEIFKIFESVFGEKSRLVRVLASQAANVWFAEKMLAMPEIKTHVDALAIAPYFGGGYGQPKQAAIVDKYSVEDLLKSLEKDAIPEAILWVKQHAKVADAAGIDLISYEGGQHLAGVAGRQDNQRLNQLFDETNRHPQMKQLYLDYFNQWEAAGGKLFTYYATPDKYSKWGRWGLAESLGKTKKSSPKLEAVLELIKNNAVK